PSDPKLKIYGNGNINIFINNRKTTFLNVENVIEIDSDPDVMEVFKEESGVLINQHQKFVRQNFPILDPGFNDISWNGNVTKIELEPRWQTKI
ncbi:phage tail protein, partial [Listeria monocytogenes]|nr:phage tail protein [Listeria monocytogenes]